MSNCLQRSAPSWLDETDGLHRVDLDWQQTKSLGLRLVQMLTKQLNGTAQLNSSDGTEFKIAFKLPETAKNGEQVHG